MCQFCWLSALGRNIWLQIMCLFWRWLPWFQVEQLAFDVWIKFHFAEVLDAGTWRLQHLPQEEMQPPSSYPPPATRLSLPPPSPLPPCLPPSLPPSSAAIWIQSLPSTPLFSSAQLLERWAPLRRSSTRRGCCCCFSAWEVRSGILPHGGTTPSRFNTRIARHPAHWTGWISTYSFFCFKLVLYYLFFCTDASLDASAPLAVTHLLRPTLHIPPDRTSVTIKEGKGDFCFEFCTFSLSAFQFSNYVNLFWRGRALTWWKRFVVLQ